MAQSQCSRRIWEQALSPWGSASPEWRSLTRPPPKKSPLVSARDSFPLKLLAQPTTIRWKSHPLISFRIQAQTPTVHLHLILQGVPEASQPRSKQVEGGEQSPPIPKPPHQRPLKSCGAMQNNPGTLILQTKKIRCPSTASGRKGGRGLGLPAPMTLFQTPSPATIINSKLFFFMTPNFSEPNSSFHHYLSHRSH